MYSLDLVTTVSLPALASTAWRQAYEYYLGSINAKLLSEREPMIGQTLIDMRGRKPAWEGIFLGLPTSQFPEY